MTFSFYIKEWSSLETQEALGWSRQVLQEDHMLSVAMETEHKSGWSVCHTRLAVDGSKGSLALITELPAATFPLVSVPHVLGKHVPWESLFTRRDHSLAITEF